MRANTGRHIPENGHSLSELLERVVAVWPAASGRARLEHERTRRIPFHVEDGWHLGGTNQIALLNHPAVYELLRTWLSKPAAAVAERDPQRADGSRGGAER